MVSKPVSCSTCGLISHPGSSCLSRTGHRWAPGELLNCGARNPPIHQSVSQIADADTVSNNDILLGAFQQMLDRGLSNLREEMKREYKAEMDRLSTTLTGLVNRMDEFEARLDHLDCAKDPEDEESIIAEIDERRRRSSNIIIRGLDEAVTGATSSNSISQQHVAVAEQIKGILQSVTESNPTIIRAYRLGKRVSGRIRPICAVLSSPEEVRLVLRNKSKIHDPVRIYSDLTTKQRNYLQNLRDQLKILHEKGETDWTIRYFNGAPKIVKGQVTPPKNSL